MNSKLSHPRREEPQNRVTHRPTFTRSTSNAVESNRTPGILDIHRKLGNQAMNSLVESGDLHPSLEITRHNDENEREAERVAERVLQMPASESAFGTMGNPERITTTPYYSASSDDTGSGAQQRSSSDPPHVSVDLERDIRSTAGGRPLPKSVRSYFEPRLGADFSNVRIHTNGKANEMNRKLNANAFTYGTDIYFRHGQYDPDVTSGDDSGTRLLAHELTHVRQNSSEPAPRNKPKSIQRSPNWGESQTRGLDQPDISLRPVTIFGRIVGSDGQEISVPDDSFVSLQWMKGRSDVLGGRPQLYTIEGSDRPNIMVRSRDDYLKENGVFVIPAAIDATVMEPVAQGAEDVPFKVLAGIHDPDHRGHYEYIRETGELRTYQNLGRIQSSGMGSEFRSDLRDILTLLKSRIRGVPLFAGPASTAGSVLAGSTTLFSRVAPTSSWW